jgi:hypothetical protein
LSHWVKPDETGKRGLVRGQDRLSQWRHALRGAFFTPRFTPGEELAR